MLARVLSFIMQNLVCGLPDRIDMTPVVYFMPGRRKCALKEPRMRIVYLQVHREHSGASAAWQVHLPAAGASAGLQVHLILQDAPTDCLCTFALWPFYAL